MLSMWSVALILVAAAPASPPVEAHTLDGQVVSGSLEGLTSQQITLRTSKGAISLPLQQLAGVNPHKPAAQPKSSAAVGVELVDGSSLMASEYTVHEGRARIALVGGSTLELPTQDIAAVRLQSPTDALASHWSRIRENETETDLLVVTKDQSLDYHRGILREVTSAAVEFQIDADRLPVKRAKVFGLIYYHPRGRDVPEPICRLWETSGSIWAVRTIELKDGNLAWTTPLGQAVSHPLADVARFDFSQGKIVYLSDLEPASVNWTPYFGGGQPLPRRSELYAPRKDIGLDSTPLELDGKTYTKGLALHSRTELVYRLPGKFHWFRALAGIDDGVRPRGNVRLVVRGDARILLDISLSGTEAAKPIDLDLQGVRRLAILVDFGEDLDVGDHLDLADARIVK